MNNTLPESGEDIAHGTVLSEEDTVEFPGRPIIIAPGSRYGRQHTAR
jgi:hypothetical protein